jgi:hypothetical protein
MSEPDSPPPRTPVVAVVGTCEESTGSFLSLLVRGDADVDRPMPAPGEVLRWTLDTKYYVADAACVFHPLPSAYLDARGGEPQVAAARDRSLALETAANAEALVLCYDPLDERAFAAVASFAGDVAEAAGDEDRPEVRVLVGLYRDAESVTTRDPGLKKARDPAETWAASRGYEALAAGAARDADAAVAAASKRPYENETGEHDDGARRVREALEAHVWPGLTMKTEKKTGSSSNVDTNVAAREDDDEKVAGTKTKKSASGADADENGDGDGDGAADESMERMESMESMLAEMARVRAAAAGASDEERRKAAAEVAKRMMRMFDLDGDASESGTESDS